MRIGIAVACAIAAIAGVLVLVHMREPSSETPSAPTPPAASAPAAIPIWPGEPAHAKEFTVSGPETPGPMVRNVARPTMTIYPPRGKNTKVAVFVFPGGGYRSLAIELEGTQICDWLVAKGITCVLLKYRVPGSGPYWDDHCKCHITPKYLFALEDAQRAIGIVRQRAAEWQIDPHKIGVLGFSAGGHLAAAVSTHLARVYPVVDDADKQSSRPDFAAALYPGHLWIDEDKFELNPDIVVTRDTPPTFLLQAEDDSVDDVNHSLVYYIALKKAGAPVEMHLYAQGGHAFALRPTDLPIGTWPQLFETWLATIHILP